MIYVIYWKLKYPRFSEKFSRIFFSYMGDISDLQEFFPKIFFKDIPHKKFFYIYT